MKLDRISGRKRPLHSADTLQRTEPTEPTESGAFDIRRDLTKQDWELIHRIIQGEVRSYVRGVVKHIGGLELLGEENRSGLDMHNMREAVVPMLRSLTPGSDTHQISERITYSCIIDPEGREDLRSTFARENEHFLWAELKKSNLSNHALFEALALYLIFPDKRQAVLSHYDAQEMKKFLEQKITHFGANEFTYFLGTALPILFPGDYTDILPMNFFAQAKEFDRTHGRLPIQSAVMAHFMTAGKVEVRADGKIIAHRKVGPQKLADLPDRNIL